MILGFEDNNEIFTLNIKEDERIKDCPGYRRGNYVLLNREMFREWISAIKVDNFVRMKEIIDSVITFESYQLSHTQNNQKLL